MNIFQLIPYARELLRGRRIRTGLICMLPFCSAVFFRLAEAAVYSLLLYFGEIEPLALFSGESPLQLSAWLVLTILRWIVTAPLLCSAVFRLSEICSENDTVTRFSSALLNRTLFRRSLGALICIKLIGLAALAPAAYFGISAYSMLKGTLGTNEVFMAVNAVVLSAVSLLLWTGLELSFAAVPYLLVKYPQKSVIRNVLGSLRFMSGRKRVLLKLGAVYFLPFITVFGIPFAVTRFMTAFSLSIDIFIREDEYRERIKAEGGDRKSRFASKLSHRKKGSLTAASHKA